MKQRRCPGCAVFYDKKLGDCPRCGHPEAAFNKWLRTAQLNSHLYAQAERASK